MSDFEALAEELLRSRPELTRDELMKRIAEKKESVGAGYLTDQGALFLVAGELGVALQRAISSDLYLKDLHVGANDITVVARVLGVYPVSTYQKKDGGTGKYRRLALFDKGHSVRLTIWDDKADEPEKLGIGVGEAVRVVSGYVKQGLDGKPNLNLGKRGRLEVADTKAAEGLITLEDVTEKPTKLEDERPILALECVVSSEPRYSEFTRSDGSTGSLFQFGVVGQGDKDQHRVVIWSPSARPELKVGQNVRVTNLKVKRSSRDEFELHGDGGSTILTGGKKAATDLRIANVSKGAGNTTILALDMQRHVKVLQTGIDATALKPGAVISVSPDKDSDNLMICGSPGSISISEENSFPSLAELSVKLKDAKNESNQIMVEVIALSQGAVDDVHLKDGSLVKKGELVVSDDTAEIKLEGWREQSSKLSGIQPGERLRVIGVTPKPTKMGAWTLQLSDLTVVEKLKGRD